MASNLINGFGAFLSLVVLAMRLGLLFKITKLEKKGIALALALHVASFVGLALLSSRVVAHRLNESVQLSAVMALGMSLWGGALLRSHPMSEENEEHSGRARGLLLIPCPPFLIAAMLTAAIVKMAVVTPAPLVGLGLGMAFVSLLPATLLARKLGLRHSSPKSAITEVGLAMMAMGCYFVASIFFSEKTGKTSMASDLFVSDKSMGANAAMKVLAALMVILALGFLSKRRDRTGRQWETKR